MIFIDSNVPMYLIGADHPLKRTTQVVLERLISEKKKLVTNAEVLQEILHRYISIDRRDAIQPAFDTLYSYVDEVFGVAEEDVLKAKDLLLRYRGLSPRDALHAAQMKRLRIDAIFSFDRGFDLVSGVARISS